MAPRRSGRPIPVAVEDSARPDQPPAAARAGFDPGWLFLIAGIAVLGTTILIPAFDELNEVRWQRDRALAIEQNRLERLERYHSYLDALKRQEPSLVLSLAASQLNQIPEGRQLILEPPDPASASASVFGPLEPGQVEFPPRVRAGSLLERMTTDDHKRPWLIAAGVLCLLFGLLPKAGGPE